MVSFLAILGFSFLVASSFGAKPQTAPKMKDSGVRTLKTCVQNRDVMKTLRISDCIYVFLLTRFWNEVLDSYYFDYKLWKWGCSVWFCISEQGPILFQCWKLRWGSWHIDHGLSFTRWSWCGLSGGLSHIPSTAALSHGHVAGGGPSGSKPIGLKSACTK